MANESYKELLDVIDTLNAENKSKDSKIDNLENEVKKAKDEITKVSATVITRKVEVEKPKPTLQIPFGDYTASCEKGIWNYKPNDILKSGTSINAKPLYKDPVQYKIMEEYEGIAKYRYQNQLGEMVKEIVGLLRNI